MLPAQDFEEANTTFTGDGYTPIKALVREGVIVLKIVPEERDVRKIMAGDAIFLTIHSNRLAPFRIDVGSSIKEIYS